MIEEWGDARWGDRVLVFCGDFVKDRHTRPRDHQATCFFPTTPATARGGGGVTAGEGGGVAVVFSSSSTDGRGEGPGPSGFCGVVVPFVLPFFEGLNDDFTHLWIF